jgi:hypothetical protein
LVRKKAVTELKCFLLNFFSFAFSFLLPIYALLVDTTLNYSSYVKDEPKIFSSAQKETGQSFNNGPNIMKGVPKFFRRYKSSALLQIGTIIRGVGSLKQKRRTWFQSSDLHLPQLGLSGDVDVDVNASGLKPGKQVCTKNCCWCRNPTSYGKVILVEGVNRRKGKERRVATEQGRREKPYPDLK